jgi:hypothetical protein
MSCEYAQDAGQNGQEPDCAGSKAGRGIVGCHEAVRACEAGGMMGSRTSSFEPSSLIGRRIVSKSETCSSSFEGAGELSKETSGAYVTNTAKV